MDLLWNRIYLHKTTWKTQIEPLNIPADSVSQDHRACH